MNEPFQSPEEVLVALADPESPRWLEAFAWLSRHPDTAALVLETFRATLEELGARPSGVDPQTGEPVFALEDVARALGVDEADLERASIQASASPSGRNEPSA